MSVGSAFMADDVNAHFDAAETALNSALLHAPNHPRAHMLLGAVQIQTDRVANGIAQCRRSLALDRNLADAHGFIGLGKYQSGHSEEVEGHIQEALRLSPRDTRTFLWFMFVGLGKLSINADLEARRLVSPEPRGQPKSCAVSFSLCYRAGAGGGPEGGAIDRRGRTCPRSRLHDPPLPDQRQRQQSDLSRATPALL